MTDALFGFFVALGNDVDADGKRDLIAHAGIRDAAGDLTKTRGYMFSGADGTFLFTFTANGDPPPPSPPDEIPTAWCINSMSFSRRRKWGALARAWALPRA